MSTVAAPRSHSPLSVAFVVDNLQVGGTELNAVRTAEQLRARGIDLSLFHLQAGGPLLERYRNAGVPTTHVPVASLASLSAASCVRALASHFTHGRFAIVHAHDLYSNLLATAAGRLARVPRVIASRRWLDSSPRPGLLVADRMVSYRLAHRVLVNSRRIGDRLVAQEGVPAHKLLVIPNFVDDEAFGDLLPAVRLEWHRRLGVPAGRVVVGTVARLAPVKDHATLVRAFARLAVARPELHLLLLGDGPERGALGELVAQLGLEQRATFAGMQSNAINLHGLLDISVLPSRSEAFPNAVVEAMAAARPVIASDVGGVPEAVDDGRTGLLFPAEDDAALAAALDRLAGSPDERATMGRLGRELAGERYGAARVMTSLIDAYRRQP